jgi:hypothetical protein
MSPNQGHARPYVSPDAASAGDSSISCVWASQVVSVQDCQSLGRWQRAPNAATAILSSTETIIAVTSKPIPLHSVTEEIVLPVD